MGTYWIHCHSPNFLGLRQSFFYERCIDYFKKILSSVDCMKKTDVNLEMLAHTWWIEGDLRQAIVRCYCTWFRHASLWTFFFQSVAATIFECMYEKKYQSAAFCKYSRCKLETFCWIVVQRDVKGLNSTVRVSPKNEWVCKETRLQSLHTIQRT